jgi:hypothetical protein
MERFGINAVFNASYQMKQICCYLPRVEGSDRQIFFAVAEPR